VNRIDVRVSCGVLTVTGEIPVASSKEDIESFVGEVHFALLGDRKLVDARPLVPVKELTEKEAAIYIGRSVSFLRRCRTKRYSGNRQYIGPKYIRCGQRIIRYPIEELDKFRAAQHRYQAICEEIETAV
jgi:hypothetical protein